MISNLKFIYIWVFYQYVLCNIHTIIKPSESQEVNLLYFSFQSTVVT